MSFLPTDIDSYNSSVKGWSDDTRREVLAEMDALGIQATGESKSPMPLRKALKTAIRRRDGIANRITFRFPRHAVFVHKGVGRGTPISQAGSTRRVAKPFLNPVVDRNIDKLTDIVADHQGNMIVNALVIR